MTSQHILDNSYNLDVFKILDIRLFTLDQLKDNAGCPIRSIFSYASNIFDSRLPLGLAFGQGLPDIS